MQYGDLSFNKQPLDKHGHGRNGRIHFNDWIVDVGKYVC